MNKGGSMQEIKVNLPPDLKVGAKFKGVFEIEVKDKLGNLISKSRAENIITGQGLNHILNVEFCGATQIATWYLVIFESDYTPLDGDTYAVPGYVEFTAFDGATRPIYDKTLGNKQVTNSASEGVFTANATKTLYGAALVGGGTSPTVKGDTAGGGTLECAGRFAANQPVIAGNVVNLTYSVTVADAG